MMMCPIDYSHLISHTKFAAHVYRCSRDNNRDGLVNCPYSLHHWMPRDMLRGHIEVCNMFPKNQSSTLEALWEIRPDKENIMFPREVIEMFKFRDEIKAPKAIVEDIYIKYTQASYVKKNIFTFLRTASSLLHSQRRSSSTLETAARVPLPSFTTSLTKTKEFIPNPMTIDKWWPFCIDAWFYLRLLRGFEKPLAGPVAAFDETK